MTGKMEDDQSFKWVIGFINNICRTVWTPGAAATAAHYLGAALYSVHFIGYRWLDIEIEFEESESGGKYHLSYLLTIDNYYFCFGPGRVRIILQRVKTPALSANLDSNASTLQLICKLNQIIMI